MTVRQAVYLISLACLVLPARATALPDLVPEIFNIGVDASIPVNPEDVIEGCAGGDTGRTLVGFSLRSRNIGLDDLSLGDPQCPDCALNPGVHCGNPLFFCSTAHGHPHFERFADYEILDNNENVLATGGKAGFCLTDVECAHPVYYCSLQGITAGCADVYDRGLPCQYVDITDAQLPEGDYILRVIIDPTNRIAEADETNNVVSVPVHIAPPPPPPPTTCSVFTATDLPKPIPDNGTAISTLTVDRPGTVEKVRVVGMRGRHTYVGDLLIRLTSPNGTTGRLWDTQCDASEAFRFDLADDALTDPPCPPHDGGLHLPWDSLSRFNGGPAAGTWRVRIDDTAAEDSGTFEAWGLEVCTTCGNGHLDPGETCDDGNLADGDCCSSDCGTAAADGTPCGQPADCVVGTCSAGTCGDRRVSCDPCLTCIPPQGCVPPEHVLCDEMPVVRSSLKMRKGADPSRDAITWNWRGGAPVGPFDFGSPSTVTDLSMCVFDETGLRMSATAPAGGICGDHACWTSTPHRISYGDEELTPDGLFGLKLRPGPPGRTHISAKGKGGNLGPLSLAMSGQVTVRLKRSGGPACWQARFPTARRNDATVYEARTP